MIKEYSPTKLEILINSSGEQIKQLLIEYDVGLYPLNYSWFARIVVRTIIFLETKKNWVYSDKANFLEYMVKFTENNFIISKGFEVFHELGIFIFEEDLYPRKMIIINEIIFTL